MIYSVIYDRRNQGCSKVVATDKAASGAECSIHEDMGASITEDIMVIASDSGFSIEDDKDFDSKEESINSCFVDRASVVELAFCFAGLFFNCT